MRKSEYNAKAQWTKDNCAETWEWMPHGQGVYASRDRLRPLPQRRAIMDWISHMDRYTFNFSITPVIDAEYEFAIAPFQVTIYETSLIVRVEGETSAEQRLQDEATLLAGDLARSLSYQLSIGYVVEYKNRHVRRESGQQSATVSFHLTVRPADFQDRELAAKQQREQAQPRIVDMARRAAADRDLRDMLRLWLRYENDPEGRLHPLYDILQVAERVCRGTKNTATALSTSVSKLKQLRKISNDFSIANGRHPGRSSGPHRKASDSEVSMCETIARRLIEAYAKKVVI
jgi:hypothetical protein